MPESQSDSDMVDMPTKVSAIDVATKTICERLYLVSGLGRFGSRVNCPCAPTACSPAISRFPCMEIEKSEILRNQKFYQAREHCHQYVMIFRY